MSSNKAYGVFKKVNMHQGDANVCWEWQGALDGVGRPCYEWDGKKSTAYRLVYQLFHNIKLPKGIVVRHKCDNKVCCNPHHLEEGTHQQNMNDMKERERHGISHYMVRAIKNLLKDKTLTHSEIAMRLGVSNHTVGRIARGEAYSHVTMDVSQDSPDVGATPSGESTPEGGNV